MNAGGAVVTAQAVSLTFAPLAAGADSVLTGNRTGTVARDPSGGSLFSDLQPSRSSLPLRRRRQFELNSRE